MQLPKINRCFVSIETDDGGLHEIEVTGEFSGYGCVESVRQGLRQVGLYTSKARKPVLDDGTHRQVELKVA